MSKTVNKALVVIGGGGLAGGGSRRFTNIYVELARRDPTCHFITNREHYDSIRRVGWLPTGTPRVHVLVNWKWLSQRRGRFLYGWLHLFQLAWFMFRWRIRLIHLVVGGVHVGAPLLLLPGARGVVSVIAANFTRVYSPATRPGYALALRRAALLDVLSPSIVPHILASDVSHPGLERKIRVAPCSFTDYTRFQPAPEKQPWVVFAARFIDIKNPLLMVDIGIQIVAQHPTAAVFILGDGPLETTMRARLNGCPGAERVVIRREDDVAPILAQASIFLSLQAQENYPSQSLLEGMASGCAILATDVGDTHLLVDETVGARLPADADQIAQFALRLLNDPARCWALGQAARQRVLTEHTLERFVDYLQNLYAEALES